MVIRDFYLGAWLIKAKGFAYDVANGRVNINIDKSTLSALTKEYTANHKEFYECVKRLIKEANESRNS